MSKFSNKTKRFLESKITTTVSIILLLTPFLVFGFILFRDSSQTGEPVIGSRFDNGLNPAISEEQLTQLDEKLVDEMIISKKVNLKSATLRVYLEVDVAVSKDEMKQLADKTYETITEVLPVETYFTLQGERKQYDLEINVYNNVEDRSGDEFVYYQIVKNATMEEMDTYFLSDAKDPEFRDEVLNNLAEKEKAAAEETDPEETEEDSGGE